MKFIPEINYRINSKTLRGFLDQAIMEKKSMRFRIDWIGKDSQQRSGGYLLEQQNHVFYKSANW
jgi:hypothetical protein